MKILIIEDEYSLEDAISETLKKEKFTTHIETDGEKGEIEETIASPFIEMHFRMLAKSK